MQELLIKPFEISLWKDVLKTNSVGTEDGYENIYKGTGTDEKDLSFWFSPRTWQYSSMTKAADDWAIINITKPDERKESLVHSDFSTSNLFFNPNTYYTFLVELDFSDGKLPDFSVYQQASSANAMKTNHYFLSVVRKNVENSMWHMPKPIFNSSLGLGFGLEGFNLEYTELNNSNEDASLFIGTTNGEKDGEIKRVILLGHLKTNNFTSDAAALGMWSFFEAWINDYWSAKIRIRVFEDNDKAKYQNIFSSYNRNLLMGASSEQKTSNIIIQTLDEAINRMFPLTSNIIGDSGTIIELKDNINKLIENYYKDLFNIILNYCEIIETPAGEGNYTYLIKSEVTEEFNKLIAPFLQNKSINGTDISQYNINLSLDIAKLLHFYIPILAFNYYRLSDNIVSKEQYFNTTLSDIQESKVDFFSNVNNILAAAGLEDLGLITPNILKSIQINSANNTVTIDSQLIDDKGILLNVDNIINHFIDEYWSTFYDATLGKNKINEALRRIYFTPGNGPDDTFSSFLNYFNINSTSNINPASDKTKLLLELLGAFGATMLRDGIINNLLDIVYARLTGFGISSSTKNNCILLLFLGSQYLLDEPNLMVEKVHAMFYDTYMQYPRIIATSENIFSFRNQGYLIRIVDYVNFLELLNGNISLFNIIVPTFKEDNRLKNITINSYNKAEKITYFDEEKICVIGSNKSFDFYAQDIKFEEKTTGDIHTLTFSLYDNYYDKFGNKTKNFIVNLLKNESKIKLHYEDKWYDFIITNISYDRIANKYDYICKDAFVSELSKIGFNKIFNTELDNNIGTIDELAKITLEGTDWTIGEQSEKLYQTIGKSVVGGKLNSNTQIIVNKYYNEDFQLNEQSFSILEGSYVYFFYEDLINGTKKPHILVFNTTPNTIVKKEDYEAQIINNTLQNVYLCADYTYKINNTDIIPDEINKIEKQISNVVNMTLLVPDIFIADEPLDFNYALRGLDIVTKAIQHFSPPLHRYVIEYKNDRDEIRYGYVQSEYTTKPLVTNFINNGEDFTSLTGWIVGSTNNFFSIKMGIDATIEGDELSTIKPHINLTTSVESRTNRGPHGFLCNTDLTYNFSALDHLTPGDDLVLRIELERGEGRNSIQVQSDSVVKTVNDDQLALFETMQPYIYTYDNIAKLQNSTSSTVLPGADKQLVTFFYDANRRTNIAGNAQVSSLYDRILVHNLVPVYWTRGTANNSIYGENAMSYIDAYPVCYIWGSLVNYWTYSGYIKQLAPSNYNCQNKKYVFTVNGKKNFRALLRNTYTDPEDASTFMQSAFDADNFAFIAKEVLLNQSSDIHEAFNTNRFNRITSFNIFDGTQSSITYYAQMLCSITEKNNIELEAGETVNRKSFLKLTHCADFLSQFEYYTLTKEDNGYRAYPHNINIDFSNNKIGDCIACSKDDDYNDFDLIIRARNCWKPVVYTIDSTCVFETVGRFYGKPTINNGVVSIPTDADINNGIAQGYNYQDLLSTNIGLFFTFGETCYDDGGRGNIGLSLSSIQLFRKNVDKDGEIILPNKIIESNSTPIYSIYDPNSTINKNAVKENDIKYEFVGNYLPDNYVLNIDETGEKKNSITITDSNCYNILQKLAELFEAWLIIDVEHESDG